MQRFKASIIKDGVLIHANLSDIPIRKNTFIVFDSDFTSIKIEDFEDFSIQKDFKSIESKNKIHIFEEGKEFIIGDYIDIYYDEYEFFGNTKVIEKHGEIFKNQKFILDKQTENFDKKTVLLIKEIEDEDIEFEVLQKGLYPELPEDGLYFVSENGAKILIDAFYKKARVKNFQSNMIKNIINGNGFIIIELINDLPVQAKSGKVITNKILIKTKNNLNEKYKENELFYIVDKKLPYLNLPYPEIEDEAVNKMFEDILFNIDAKLAILEKKLQDINCKNNI